MPWTVAFLPVRLFARGQEAHPLSLLHPCPSVTPVAVTSPGCCCCPGPPESGLWARRWCRQWQLQSGAPDCGARDRGPGSEMGIIALSPDPGSQPTTSAHGGVTLTKRPAVLPLPAAVPGRGGKQALSPAAAATPAHSVRPVLEAVGPGKEYGG